MEFFKQTTKYTCAASSLMMIINHFNEDFFLSRENEFMIWQKTVALPTRGSNIFALAIFSHKQGVPSKVIVEHPEYKATARNREKYENKEIELAAFVSNMFKDRAKRMGINIEERGFELGEIKDLLVREKKIILVRLSMEAFRKSEANKKLTHYLPIFDYDGGKFILADPKKGIIKFSDDELKNALDSVKQKCNKDNRMIVFG